jgi:hypothetical protein
MAHGADVDRATITVTCSVPTFADNGTWQVEATVNDSSADTQYSYPGTATVLSFTVVGGSNDTSPPHLDSWSINPTPVHPSSTFTLTAQFTDPSGVSAFYVAIPNVIDPTNYLQCSFDPQITVVSPTPTSFAWSCNGVAGHTTPGLYSGYIRVGDQLGHAVNAPINNITVS